MASHVAYDPKMDALYTSLSKIAHPYRLIISQDNETNQIRVELRDAKNMREVNCYIDQGHLFQANFPNNMLAQVVKNLREGLEGNTMTGQGDYPDVRGWAKARLTNTSFSDDEPIPGWIWPRWSNAHPGMKALKTGGVVPTGSIKDPRTGAKSMTPKKKVVTTKGAVIRDPSKVKKPKCPLHTDLAMKFDPLRSVWECVEPTCNIIAQPKQEKEQGRVTLGKGEVHLRIILQEDVKPSIALISDDNIALDITNMVDWEELKTSYELDEILEATKESGLDTISIPMSNSFQLTAKADVVGAPFYRP